MVFEVIVISLRVSCSSHLAPKAVASVGTPSQSVTGDNLIHHDVTAHYRLLLLTSHFTVGPQHSIQVQAHDQTHDQSQDSIMEDKFPTVSPGIKYGVSQSQVERGKAH